MNIWLVAGLLLMSSNFANAAVEVQQFDTGRQQALYQKLVTELRCLVCQNQNLADSNAELALDLRRQTAEMIRKGNTEAEIVDYMVARYGDFVLYRPPLKSSTWLLWGGPLVILFGGLIIALRFVRGRTPVIVEDTEVRARAERALSRDTEQ